ATFRQFLSTRFTEPGAMSVHTISCPVVSGGCAARGASYINLANDAIYKGVAEDLRTSQWTPIFDALVASIQAKAKLNFKLNNKPVSAGAITVHVNGKKLASSAYAYAPATNSVTLSQGAAKAGDEIIVSYSAP